MAVSQNIPIGSRISQKVEQKHSLQFDDEDDDSLQIHNGINKPENRPFRSLQLKKKMSQQSPKKVSHIDPDHESAIDEEVNEAEHNKNHNSENFVYRELLTDIRFYFAKYQHSFQRDLTFRRMKKQFFKKYMKQGSLQNRIQEVQHQIWKKMMEQGFSFKAMVKRQVHFNPQFKNAFEHYVHELFYLYQERSKREVARLNKHLLGKQESQINNQSEQDQFNEAFQFHRSANRTVFQLVLSHDVDSGIRIKSEGSSSEPQQRDMQIEQDNK